MRLNYVLNDNYVNKNNDKNENDIKYNTSPITLRDFNKKKIPEKKKDFGSTVSLFNDFIVRAAGRPVYVRFRQTAAPHSSASDNRSGHKFPSRGQTKAREGVF